MPISPNGPAWHTIILIRGLWACRYGKEFTTSRCDLLAYYVPPLITLNYGVGKPYLQNWMLVSKKSSFLGFVLVTYFRVGSKGLGGNSRGPGGLSGFAGHNHLGAISSRPSNCKAIWFRLREGGRGAGGCVCSRAFIFFPNHGTTPQVSNGYDLLS